MGQASVRLRASGNLARVIVLSLGGILLVAAISPLGNGLESTGRPSADDFIALIVWLVVLVPLLARSAMLGVWLTGDQIVARSWFRTYRLQLAAIARCDSAEYYGWLRPRGGADTLSMLEFRMHTGDRVSIPSSLALHGRAVRQLEVIRGWLGTDASLRLRGDAPRSARRDPRHGL